LTVLGRVFFARISTDTDFNRRVGETTDGAVADMAKNKNLKAKAQQARKQRRNDKRKKKQVREANRVPIGVRIKQRLAKRMPDAWVGEDPADAAIFETAAFNGLTPDLQSHVTAVREGLKLVCASQASEATARIADIPRSSPLSEWRLLIRGLTSWLDDDHSAAKEVWNRLNANRRPGRIATAIVAAPLPDLETLSLDSNGTESIKKGAEPREIESVPMDASLLTDSGVKNRLDISLLQSARFLCRVRIDRAAIRIALTGATQAEEDSDLLIGPAKMKWLRDFSRDFEDTEPQLVHALQQAALQRAFHQHYLDLFSAAVGYFKGPAHDRRNELLSFFFYGSGEDRANRHFLNYVDMDLKNNERISEPLRKALVSECCLRRASQLISQDSDLPFYARFNKGNNDKEIERLLKKSISSYPANRAAIQAHVEWLKEKLDDNNVTTAADREPLEKKMSEVMKAWSEALPEDVEPRLWLVDHLLENGELAAAQPFIEWLRVARQDDPKIRALPWKWQVLDTLRLCRRKSDFAKVPEKLQSIESEWPAWLSTDWLAYLQAAFQLRTGNTEAFEQQRTQICEQQKRVRDCPRDACMILAAAQGMNVAAADLKPLRAVVDAAVGNVKSISIEDLLDLGEFFWDLHRIQIIYPAYRMHGSKFGRELISRVDKGGTKVREWLKMPAFRHGILWASEHRCWPNNDDPKFPKCLEKDSDTEPLIAAARINYFLQCSRLSGMKIAAKSLEFLRNLSTTERDLFYRYWFTSLVERADREIEDLTKQRYGFGGIFGQIARSFGMASDDETEDEEDDFNGEDDDEECNCERCVAERAKAERQPSGSRTF